MNGIAVNKIYKICIPNTLHDSFDYQSDRQLVPGMRVLVPFRNSNKLGIVIEEIPSSLYQDKIKAVAESLDDLPLLPASLLKLCLWVAAYYQSPLSQIIRLALPKKLRLTAPLKPVKPLETEKNQGLKTPLTLNAEQQLAVEQIRSNLHHYHCFLLQGITGSGKTEVYLQVIASVISQNKQVLILVPEIGLTPQLVLRFKERFNVPIVTIHSHLTETARLKAWFYASTNQARIVIGTRTAVFTPMPDLGFIVIDEEHDSSFKQMEGVRYSARDTAIMRAASENIPLVLGSATPGLESIYNCMKQKYSRIYLRERAQNKTALHYDIVDLTSQKLQHGLATQSLQTIQKHLNQNNQVLVFINQRGFAPVLFCSPCKTIIDCPRCDAHLIVHKKTTNLRCHHCGLNREIPKKCPKCASFDLTPLGIGTQRLTESLELLFPQTRILRIDRDEVQKKDALDMKLSQIANREVQLIVGTQMLAKGHDFPDLSLVVIVNADGGFCSADIKATEQMGQLLTQVAGRAGRANKPGQVLLQTAMPHHPLLNLLIQRGYEAFCESLMESRRAAKLPPFYYLAIIRAEDKQIARLSAHLSLIKEALDRHPLIVLGPAPALLARKANLHRMQLLVKSASRSLLQAALLETRNKFKNMKGFCWHIDVDPINLD